MRCLLLVDIQNDFLPGGALAVPDGDAVVPVANRLAPLYPLVAATQDWHPLDHGSFAANHAGAQPGEVFDLDGLPQILWPVHCVQQTGGALFAPGLQTRFVRRVFCKGTDHNVDSYSGFFDNGRRRATGLNAYLQEQSVDELHVLGLATDYCVKFTVLDVLQLGYRVVLVEDGCRGVELQEGDCRKAIREMTSAGAVIRDSQSVADELAAGAAATDPKEEQA